MPSTPSPSAAPSATPSDEHAPRPRRRALTALLAALLTTGAAVAAVATSPVASSAASTNVVPPTPAGLNQGIEGYQPYVGQRICDPVAKSGVSAFRDLLLTTYPASGSLGIVRDCGSGGQSEHKEGRAFDWANSASDPTDVANVNALLAWLTKTDQYGNANAMVRRTGLMYMIWNKRIWKSYQVDKGWQPYYGASPHTDHVHFSFGWAGARRSTSYWKPGSVAAIDYGPNAAPPPAPTITVSPDRTNIAIRRNYGALTLAAGQSQNANAVKVVQSKVLAKPVDGVFGSGTASAVRSAQNQLKVPVTGSFAPADWETFFPLPTAPFGTVNSITTVPGGIEVTGWAVDNDTPDPIQVTFTTKLGQAKRITADLDRADVAAAYPASGAKHGFSTVIDLPDGTHDLCVNGANAATTPGHHSILGCAVVTVKHSPQGGIDGVLQKMGTTFISGWALDTDTADPVQVRVTVDGQPAAQLPASGEQRPEVATRFPRFGAARGFVQGLDLAEGKHQVCAIAVNAGAGASSVLGCRTLTVNRSPAGAYESARTVPTTADTPAGRSPLVVSGWAFDRDTAAPILVRVKVNGVVKRTVLAKAERADVGRAFPAYGAAHGFTTSLDLPAGVVNVCLEAVNAGKRGTTTQLGCKPVTLGHPVGAIEKVGGGKGVLAVQGFAFDPDAAISSQVGVFVDGVRTLIKADRDRPDLSTLKASYGTLHGFRADVPATAGSHRVCVTAYNLSGTSGKNQSLGCKTIKVS